MPDPVSRLELTFPNPCTSATTQVHGPLSTEALKPSWLRSSVADCSASGTSIAVRLWSTDTPTLTPGAMRAPNPATPPRVCRISATKALRAPLLPDTDHPIGAGGAARAEPCDAAPGLPMIADEIALRAGPGRNSVDLSPGPEARLVGRFGGTATGRIAPQSAPETIRRLVSKALQEIAAEIRHGRA